MSGWKPLLMHFSVTIRVTIVGKVEKGRGVFAAAGEINKFQ